MSKIIRDPRARGCKRALLLKDEERFLLVQGPYEPPHFDGEFLIDAIRGKVRFGKYSNALIPWPIFKKKGSVGSGGHVLCGDLLRALEKESVAAICYHWGVCAGTVLKWRRALGLTNKGLTPGAARMVNIGVDLCKLPGSQARLAASARTREISPEAREAISQSVLKRLKGKYDARAAYYLRTGRFPKAGRSDPWLPEEEKLLANHSTRDLMEILGRTWEGIKAHRRKLNLRLRPTNTPWQETEINILGSDTDAAIAKRLQRSAGAVKGQRQRLHIPAFRVAG